jgi:DNA gyrase/topoisomerase IV subunit A
MKLRNLNKEYLKNKIKEFKNVEDRINELDKTKNSNKLIDKIIINDMKEVKQQFAIPRKTLFIK